jgi:hypothetical protein
VVAVLEAVAVGVCVGNVVHVLVALHVKGWP